MFAVASYCCGLLCGLTIGHGSVLRETRATAANVRAALATLELADQVLERCDEQITESARAAKIWRAVAADRQQVYMDLWKARQR